MASSSIFFFLFFFLLSSSSSSLVDDPSLLLEKIKPALEGPTTTTNPNLQLSSWNASNPLCTWRGIVWSTPCDPDSSSSSSSSMKNKNATTTTPSVEEVISIHLPASSLSGSLPKEISQLSSLRSLHLAANSLTGPIPPELGNTPSLSDLDLSSNALSGPIPFSIWNLCSSNLTSLRLRSNNLSSSIPLPPEEPTTTCPHLTSLDLSSNSLSGDLPSFLTSFPSLRLLDLSSNDLSGSIPNSLFSLPSLRTLNLSYNNLTLTSLPPQSARFGPQAFLGNNIAAPSSRHNNNISSGVVAGIVIGLMAGVVVLASVSIGWYQGGKNRRRRVEEDEIEEDLDDGEEGKLIVFPGGEHLTLEHVLNATGQVMEKTNYGTVYKARLADGGTIALRLLREGSCKDSASCVPVVRHLGRARHENVVPLRAFYQGKRGEKLLIYDYLHNTTLHHLLHESRAGRPLLNWAKRHKIALGVARGLAYLHTGQETPITHGNVRSKNVLVDDFFVSRLTEYGLDKLMIPSVADEMIPVSKSDGYRAPELHKMKKCNTRTDVYAFGILLLEILMGKKEADLPSLVKVAVLEETTMEVFDTEVLKGIRSPTEEGLVQALKLAMGCCAPMAEVRPDMREVVKILEENRPRNRSALYSPADTRSEIGTPF